MTDDGHLLALLAAAGLAVAAGVRGSRGVVRGARRGRVVLTEEEQALVEWAVGGAPRDTDLRDALKPLYYCQMNGLPQRWTDIEALDAALRDFEHPSSNRDSVASFEPLLADLRAMVARLLGDEGSRGVVRRRRGSVSDGTTRSFRILVLANRWNRRDHLVSLVDGVGSSRAEGSTTRPRGRVVRDTGIARVVSDLEAARAFALEWSDQLGGCEVWEWSKEDGSHRIREARPTARLGPFRLVRTERRVDYQIEVWAPTWPIPGRTDLSGEWRHYWHGFEYVRDPYRSTLRPDGDLEQVLSDLANPKPTTTFSRGGLVFDGQPQIPVLDYEEARATVEVAP